jgi:hypothetical protein
MAIIFEKGAFLILTICVIFFKKNKKHANVSFLYLESVQSAVTAIYICDWVGGQDFEINHPCDQCAFSTFTS